MADISKCVGGTPQNEMCPKKESCYRFTAPSNPQWQTWFAAPPNFIDGNCEMFMENKNGSN